MASFAKLFRTGVAIGQLCWSLSPFYSPADRVARAELIGTFHPGSEISRYASSFFGGGEEVWDFSEYCAPEQCRLSFTGRGDRRDFEATLFRVAVRRTETLFLDLTPVEGAANPLMEETLLAGHLVFRVSFEDGGMSLWPLEPGWVHQDQARRGRPLYRRESRVLLTEETDALRLLLRRASADPGAFTGPFHLYRAAKTPETGR